MDMETDKLVSREELIREIILLLNSASYHNLEILMNFAKTLLNKN